MLHIKKMSKIQLNLINDILPSNYTNRIPVAFWLKKGLNCTAFGCPWREEGGICHLTTIGALSASWGKSAPEKFKGRPSCLVRHLQCGFLLKRTYIPWTLCHNRFPYELGICRPNDYAVARLHIAVLPLASHSWGLSKMLLCGWGEPNALF